MCISCSARLRWTAAWFTVMCAAASAGCSRSNGPEFALNLEGRDKATIAASQLEAVAGTLASYFGTPDRPRIPEGALLDAALLDEAAGPIGGDAVGNQWGLFRRHCVGCHGISGDGAGPAAAVLDPYPRDFRNGTFKYTSTAFGAKPTREDLRRTLRHGVADTAMPSFGKLPERQMNALVEYVVYLSLRGEAELCLFQRVVEEEADLPFEASEVMAECVRPAAASWAKADNQVILPPPPPAIDAPRQRELAVERGRKLFFGSAARCTTCHGTRGDGRGEQTDLYDDWNRRKLGATPDETRRRAQQFQLPIERLRPRDFTRGVFRGGSQPIDQYRRIHAGVKGTPMPPAGPSPGLPGVLTPEEIWRLVFYVRSLGPQGGG